ncbi:hypothetical protein MD484_g4249, partial [Candolleomyces efflorescens]
MSVYTSDTPAPLTLEESGWIFFNGTLFQVVCTTIVLWDHISTFDLEVELIWKKKLSLAQILYFVNRYVGDTLFLYGTAGKSFGTVQTFLSVTTLGAMQVSMYRHERKILVGLAATFIIEMTAACVLMGLSVRLNGFPIFLTETLRSCVPVKMVAWSSALWFLMMIFDFLIFMLAVREESSEILANTRWSKERSLLRILLRDSIVFPFIGLLMCMFNTLAWYVLPLGALQYTMSISAMGSPILGCRLILNLRDAYYRPFADEFRNSTLRGKEPCVKMTP